MRNFTRRQSGGLWHARWLLPLGVCLLPLLQVQAQSRRETTLEAMGPPTISGPVITNKIAPPDFGRFPNPMLKQETRGLAWPAPVPPPGPVSEAPPPPGVPAPGPGPLPAPDVTAPQPAPQAPLPLENPDQVLLSADRLQYLERATQAEGNVELRYQEIIIRSFRGQLDREQVWGGFTGDVRMQASLYSATADELRINLETEDFSATNAAAEVSPEYFQGQVIAPVYVRADEVVGRPNRVTATDGIATTCNFWPDPHWMLQSDSITLVPEDWVSFEKPALYFFGRRILRYPWDLHLSLRRRENRFLPEIGQNDVEGFYAKFAYGYMLNEENTGFLRLHLTQKRGVGLGFNHTLETERQFAEISVFGEPSEGSLTGRLLHRGQYSTPFSSNLSMSFQRNSGYGLGSDSLSADLTLRYDTVPGQTLVGLQHSLLSSDVSTSRRTSTNFSHRQRTGADGNWEIRSTYRSSSFIEGQAADEELETQFTWRQVFPLFTADLSASQRFDVDGDRYTADSSYFALNRLPDLVLTTDSARLGGLELFHNPFNATVYLGYFDQQPDDLQTYRTGLDLRLPGATRQLGAHSSLRTSARFRQMFYEEAAQWIAEAQAEYRLELPGYWQTRLRYNYVKPHGFAPVRLDYASEYSVLYFEAVRLVAERMRLDLSFGRDFRNGTYHDAILRSEWMLSPRNRIELQGGYSLELDQFRPLNLRWIYATTRTWWSALTVNYDVDNTDLTNVSVDVDWTPSDKWRVQFLGGYSSFGGFDQADIRVTRDLHCMVAQATYSNTTGEFRLGLGIKAFPSDTRTFGVGASGRYFESNFGDVY